MEEKNFHTKLLSINEVKFPLVKAAFKGKDGEVYIGVMLIDTGSVECILNYYCPLNTTILSQPSKKE